MEKVKLPDINSVIISGQVTHGYELNKTYCGCHAKLSFAYSRKYKSVNGEWKEKKNYFSCTLWDEMAQGLDGKISKGSPIIVEGCLRRIYYRHSSRVEIICRKIHLLETGVMVDRNDYSRSIFDDESVPF